MALATKKPANLAEIATAVARMWPVLLILVGLLAAWLWLPDKVLTQRYFRNIYFQPYPRGSFNSWPFFLLIYLQFIPQRWSSLLYAAALIAGPLVAAVVVNSLGSELIAAFYILYAFWATMAGAAAGLIWQRKVISGIIQHVFDPAVDLANRAFRLIVVLVLVTFLLLVVAGLAWPALDSGAWRQIESPQWQGWPYVACCLWGCLWGYFAFSSRPAKVA